jgi:hypothetical protein
MEKANHSDSPKGGSERGVMAETGQEVHPFTREYYSVDLDALADKLAVANASVVEWAVRELRIRVATRKARRRLAEQESRSPYDGFSGDL